MTEAKAHILVIDDDPSILEMIGQTLSPLYETTTTAEWLEGVDLLVERPFDLLVLDLGMPVFDAPEFIKSFRANLSRTDTPILVISAYPNLRERLAGLPVDGFLPKPFALQTFLDMVSRLLESRRPRLAREPGR
jgi:CheY-like chemotaxis protein